MDLPLEILCNIYRQTTNVITLSRLLQTHRSFKLFLHVCVKELTLDQDKWIFVPMSFINQFAHVTIISFPIILRTEKELKGMVELEHLQSATFINEMEESLPNLVSIVASHKSMWPSKFLFVDERTKNIIATNQLYNKNALILSHLRPDYSLIMHGLANSRELVHLLSNLFQYNKMEILIIDLLHISSELLSGINNLRLVIYVTIASPFELLFDVANDITILSSGDFYNYSLSGYLEDLDDEYPNMISLVGLLNLEDFLDIMDLFPNLKTLGIYSDLNDPMQLIQNLHRLPLTITKIIIYTSHQNPQIPYNFFPSNKQISIDYYDKLFLDYESLIRLSYPYFNKWLDV